MLQGCASYGDLAVDITNECNKLRQEHTPLPRVTPDSDYRKLAAQAGTSARDTDRKNASYFACVDRVIARYRQAGGGS